MWTPCKWNDKCWDSNVKSVDGVCCGTPTIKTIPWVGEMKTARKRKVIPGQNAPDEDTIEDITEDTKPHHHDPDPTVFLKANGIDGSFTIPYNTPITWTTSGTAEGNVFFLGTINGLNDQGTGVGAGSTTVENPFSRSWGPENGPKVMVRFVEIRNESGTVLAKSNTITVTVEGPPAPVGPLVISNLYNTGIPNADYEVFDSNGNRITTEVKTNYAQYTNEHIAANDEFSSWEGAVSYLPSGSYTIRKKFILSGDVTEASLKLGVAVPPGDTASIRINGTAVPGLSVHELDSYPTFGNKVNALRITSGFVLGENVLEVIVQHSGFQGNLFDFHIRFLPTISNLYNTGLGPEGSIDPHWTILRSTDNLQHDLLIVSQSEIPNDTESKCLEVSNSKPNEVYTIGTTFNLTGTPSAWLYDGLFAKWAIKEIRLNGNIIETGAAAASGFVSAYDWTGQYSDLNKGFVSGANHLEFDVYCNWNGSSPARFRCRFINNENLTT